MKVPYLTEIRPVLMRIAVITSEKRKNVPIPDHFGIKPLYWGIIITSSKVNQSHEGDRDHDDIFDELV